MPITSLIVECQPGHSDSVVARLAGFANAEVTHRQNDGVVVVTDTETQEEDHALLLAIGSLTHVISAIPVYTNREDLPLTLEPLPALEV